MFPYGEVLFHMEGDRQDFVYNKMYLSQEKSHGICDENLV